MSEWEVRDCSLENIEKNVVGANAVKSNGTTEVKKPHLLVFENCFLIPL
jgi:hypothetical protein